MKLGIPTESLLGSLPDGVFVTDIDGRITWTNPAFSSMCGRNLEEMMGKRPETFLPGTDTDPEAATRLAEAFRDKHRVETEFVNFRSDGRAYWAHLAIHPVENETGAVGFIGIEQDRSAARREIDRLEDEVIRLYQILVDVAPGIKAEA